MSKGSKIVFLIAGLVLVATFAVQLMTGLWLNLNSILLGLSASLVAFAVFLDWKLYVEFLGMRTTKHGMNMGAMILMVFTLLVCVNYLAHKHNKTWDVTKERANSLAEQTEKILDGLKDTVTIKVFYKGPAAAEDKARAKTTLQMFQNYTSHLKVHFLNSYTEQAEAVRELADQPDRDNLQMIGFVEAGGRKVRVEDAFDEAAVTSALIKATRQGESKVYFLKGHGERDLDSEGDQGLKEFAKGLTDASFKVENLVLIDRKEIPKDAAVLAIVGPALPYLEQELEWLREYLRHGGHIFMALDPGQRHNLANLTKPLGIEFENNFVIAMSALQDSAQATVLGRGFDVSSEITRTIPNGSGFAVFDLASEVRPALDKVPGLEVRTLVKSGDNAFVVSDISKPVSHKATSAIGLAVESRGTLPGDGNLPFASVVFGDSDFISNRGLILGVNRDLALNAMAALANQQDLISIRPKLPKGTAMMLTTFEKWMVVLLGLALPVLLLMTSGVLWFRRRGA